MSVKLWTRKRNREKEKLFYWNEKYENQMIFMVWLTQAIEQNEFRVNVQPPKGPFGEHLHGHTPREWRMNDTFGIVWNFPNALLLPAFCSLGPISGLTPFLPSFSQCVSDPIGSLNGWSCGPLIIHKRMRTEFPFQNVTTNKLKRAFGIILR